MADFFNTLSSIVKAGLNIYVIVHFVAILFTWINSDTQNQLVSYINRITMPMWSYVERFLPYMWKSLSALASILILYWLEFFLPPTISNVGSLSENLIGGGEFLTATILLALFATGVTLKSILFFIMVISVVWFVINITSAPLNNPFVRMIYVVIDPLLSPIQRYLPKSSIDISPLALAVLAWLGGELIDFIIHKLSSFFS